MRVIKSVDNRQPLMFKEPHIPMAGFGDLVQKAFYLGVGIASYAGEKAGSTLGELRSQAQKIADEMVARGEMTTEEAKRLVDEMVNRAAQQPDATAPSAQSTQPRRIEILEDEASATPEPKPEAVDDLRQQVIKLQEELRRLKRES
jgi:polyhydroxyalkanoate synthesis regulator phasin